MTRFKNWLEQNTLGTDEVVSQIDGLYDKAKHAIKIAQIYVKSSRDPNTRNLLKNISTIAPLASGVYGLYNSSENKAVIGQKAYNTIRFKFGSDAIRQQNNLQKLPIRVISQYVPDIDPQQIVPSDVIHVNVKRIVSELGDSMESVLQIASTIIHEATHEMEYRTTGRTSETGPRNAETLFMSWAKNNLGLIYSAVPELKTLQIRNQN